MSEILQWPLEGRPLKYNLTSSDLLYFLHIPKTAGTTFFEILSRQYEPYEIISEVDGSIQQWLTETSPEQFSQYRLMRAHFDYSIYRMMPRRPVIVTFLRNPIERMISAYEHVKRVPQHKHHELAQDTGILEYMEMVPGPFRNMQTRFVVGEKLRDKRTRNNLHQVTFWNNTEALSYESVMDIAKVHLTEFAFFGLKERFEESIQLLTHTFGWQPVSEYEALNTAPHPSRSDLLTPEELGALTESNKMDIELYKFANELFSQRIARMHEEIQLSEQINSQSIS